MPRTAPVVTPGGNQASRVGQTVGNGVSGHAPIAPGTPTARPIAASPKPSRPNQAIRPMPTAPVPNTAAAPTRASGQNGAASRSSRTSLITAPPTPATRAPIASPAKRATTSRGPADRAPNTSPSSPANARPRGAQAA